MTLQAGADTAPHGREAAVPADALLGVNHSRQFFPELESLRGLAVLLVVAFHVDSHVVFAGGQRPPSAVSSFVRAGDTGVDLFFVLSGFLLTLPFLAAARGGPPVSLRFYLSRRALRILPLYYAAVLAGAAIAAAQTGDLLRGLPYLLFLNSFTVAAPLWPFSAVWWSLATEVQFYLLLPLCALMLHSRTGLVLGALALAGYGLAYAALVQGVLHLDNVQDQIVLLLSIVGRGPVFLCGIAAAWIVALRGDRLRARLSDTAWLRAGGADVVLAAVAVGMAFFLRAQVEHMQRVGLLSAAALPWHVGAGLLWAAIMLWILLAPLRSKALLCNAALARLGVLSYSIYLLHVPILLLGLRAMRRYDPDFWDWTPPMLLFLALLAAVGYAAATLTYTWIERPFLARKVRFE